MNLDNFDNNLEKQEKSNKIRTNTDIIKTQVYGIIDKSLNKRMRNYSIKNNEVKYGKGNRNSLDEEITQNKLGKIIERVITEFLLHEKLIKTGELTQERHGVDFIIKVGNIKIGTDFTINSYYINEESKRIKIYNSAAYIDNGSSLGSTTESKKPDITSLFVFDIDNQICKEIMESFKRWYKNSYTGYWTDYIEKNYEIVEYFNKYISLLKDALQQVFENGLSEYFFDNGINSINLYETKDSIKIEIKDELVGKEIIRMYIYLTNKYKTKIGEPNLIKRVPLIRPQKSNLKPYNNGKQNGIYTSENIYITSNKKSKS